MNPTKVAIVLASICAAVVAQMELSDEHMKKMMEHHKECKVETKIDDELATGIMMGKFPEELVLKQHIFCVSKRLGIQNEDGEIQREAVHEKISRVLKDEVKIQELTEKCSMAMDSPEETAFQLAKCIYEGSHA